MSDLAFLNKAIDRLYKTEEEAQSEEELIDISQAIEYTKLLIAECEVENERMAN